MDGRADICQRLHVLDLHEVVRIVVDADGIGAILGLNARH